MSANDTVTAVVDNERRRRGLNRVQLAAVLGVNTVWVSRKLNGDRAWTMADLDLVSERLEVPLPVLLMEPVEVVTLRSRLGRPIVTRKYGSLVSSVSSLCAVGA
jgi:transcriptional regulator with XRE-family HTH domain